MAVVAVGLLLVGCATPREGGPDGSDRSGGGSGGAGGADPVELVNLWRVSGAEGEVVDTWLRLDVGSYQLWRDCGGFLEGGWAASGRVFVASAPFAVNAECMGAGDDWPTVPWLEDTRAYEAAGDGWRLLGADGAVLATLTIDGAPAPIPTAADFYAEPPEVTDEARESLAGPSALPGNLAPVTAEALIGRWVPVGGARNDPFAEFAADGTWTGSDGCNGSSGAWGVDDDGRLLTTGGPTTAMACDGAAVPNWATRAGRAGFDGEVLVLLDPEGAELGRLVRS
jgi:hypothetical protein